MASIAPYAYQVENIEGETFLLNPEGDSAMSQLFDHERGYAKTLRFAQKTFTRQSQCKDTALNHQGVMPIRKLIPADVCRKLIQHYHESSSSYLRTREGTLNLLDAIFNEQLDAEIISHFGSEYMPLWHVLSENTYEEARDSCSFKWHCDGGPSKHLKIMVYLNDSDEHGANTLFSNPAATQALKKIGYVYCGINERKEDLRLLTAAHHIPHTENSFSLHAGDALIFNPYEVMHRGKAPNRGKVRYVLSICLVPSPVHWREAIQSIRWPSFGCIDFIDFTAQIKNAFEFSDDASATSGDLVLIEQNYTLNSLAYTLHTLESFFKPTPLSTQVVQNYVLSTKNLKSIPNVLMLVNDMKGYLQATINAQLPGPQPEMIGLLQEILAYEQDFLKNCQRYKKSTKPNPDAVWWPDPTRAEGSPDLFQMMPYVHRHPFITKSTPIGSAGSCFAIELSKQFQREGFNYIVAERADDASKGVFVDGYQAGDLAKFSASYGIQFNTPSFRQLVEKAFHKRQFKKMLSQEGPELLMDPYRENVFFTSQQAYLDDYPKHLQAVRDTFMTCEAFIITLGLNECWEFIHDGSVMSRNPKQSMYHLVRAKVLTLQENIDNLQTFLDIVRSYNPDFKLIISLSPIPFLITHQSEHQHVIEANCHSKAVLRLAAEHIVKNNHNVFYLPSYELVTNCTKDAWCEDNRHVKDEVVQRVIEMFKEMFVVQ